MSGRVGDLSIKQAELLDEFKILLSDVLEPKHDDHLLLQFLRARRFDLKKSEDMFRKHLLWRKKCPEEYMATDYKPLEMPKTYCVAPFLGFDKEGSPVRVINIGEYDLKGIVNSARTRDMEDYAVWCLDTDKKNMKPYNAKLGRYVETRTFILDLDGLSLRNINKGVLELLVAYLRLYESNYPENLKTAFILNIPYFFAWIYNLVKSVLTEDTIQKLKIYGKDGYHEELFKIMDPEIVPGRYGGTRTDEYGDPRCLPLFGNVNPIPTRYYLKNQRKLSKEDDGVREIMVGRRAKKEVAVYADSPDSTIFWEIEVLHQDVNFGLFYKKEVGDQTELEELVPFSKTGGDYGPSSGGFVTQKAGKHLMVFDNGFSFIRSKKVLYRITVMPSRKNDKPTIPY